MSFLAMYCKRSAWRTPVMLGMSHVCYICVHYRMRSPQVGLRSTVITNMCVEYGQGAVIAICSCAVLQVVCEVVEIPIPMIWS